MNNTKISNMEGFVKTLNSGKSVEFFKWREGDFQIVKSLKMIIIRILKFLKIN